MKTVKLYFNIFICITVMGITSCNDDFMQQIPQTAVTVEGFFNSTSDLQTYVNNFYNDGTLNSGGWFGDLQSDDVTINTNSDDVMFKGLLNDQFLPENAGGWDGWGSLRSVNVMLTNLDRVAGSEADINHLVGIARYFRAWFYIGKVEAYSDVPWIDRPLSTTDEQLYLAQTPRAEVVQHIFEDLDYAAEWIKPAMGDRTQIHKYCALALISRFALYEGTFRKYHPELGLASTADALLQKSIEASEAIINSGLFEITGKGVTDLSDESLPGVAGSTGFRNLFISMDLSGNKEVILWRRYGENKGGANMSDLLMTTSGSDKYSLSRSLQESFLTKDGRPYSTVAGYDRKTFSEVFVDRDPRFAETFAYPGISTIVSGGKTSHVPNPQRGGYSLGKYYLRDYNRDTYAGASLGQYNGLPIYRYAEILLNYAEAKAELGGLTAAIVNQTINELRDRVGMPHFDADREVDATLRSLYPNVGNTLLAIRRERRVELAGEGLRLRDISRWYAGKVMELDISKQGIYVPSPPFVYIVPGTTNVGFGIATNQSSKTSANVKWYYLETEPFYLSGAGSGFIRNVDDQSRKFDEPRDYYRPIPRQQTVLNPNLTQPYGWEE